MFEMFCVSAFYLEDVSKCCLFLYGFWRCSWNKLWRRAWAAGAHATGNHYPSANQGGHHVEWHAICPPTSKTTNEKYHCKISKATLQFWKDDIWPLFDISLHQARVSITSWHEKSPLIWLQKVITQSVRVLRARDKHYSNYELRHRQKLHIQRARNNSKAQNMLYRSMLAQSLCIITCIHCIFSTAAQVN